MSRLINPHRPDPTPPRGDAPRANPVVAMNAAKLGWLGQYGIQPERVSALKFMAGPCTFSDLPEAARKTLSTLHAEGHARGMELMSFIYHARPLAKDEALYLAHLATAPGVQPQVVAFIGPRKFG